MTYRRAYLFTLVCICLLVVAPPAFGQSSYHYAYLRDSVHGSAAEEIDTLDSPADTRAYPIPPGWALELRGVPSPDGVWIAWFLFSEGGRRMAIQLYSPASGETRTIADHSHTWTYGRKMVWSPNSDYLALIFGQEDPIGLWVYSVADERLTKLADGSIYQRDAGWSPDSAQVLTFTRPCDLDEACPARLDLYDTAGGTPHSVDLDGLPFGGHSACDPLGAPGGRNVSFVSNCGGEDFATVDFPNEVYLWDLLTGTLRPITAFGKFSGTGSPLFQASYRQAWLDDHTLLIGVNYRFGVSDEQRELLLYDADDGTMRTLSRQLGSRFALDTAVGRIALRSHIAFDAGLGGQSAQIGIVTLNDLVDLPYGALDRIVSESPLEIAAACRMEWSPDGATLAVTTSVESCEFRLDGVVLIDGASGAVQEYPLQVPPDQHTYTSPLGWLQF